MVSRAGVQPAASCEGWESEVRKSLRRVICVANIHDILTDTLQELVMVIGATAVFVVESQLQLVECAIVLVSVMQRLRIMATRPKFLPSTCEIGMEIVMVRPVITTERLKLRPMKPQHLQLHRQLDTDPKVMRYLLGRGRTPEETDEFWEPRCADTIADAAGMGWWVGFVDGCFVGWWDLGRSDSDPAAGVKPSEAEIGWRVVRSQWGQGLAPEGAVALLQHGFVTVGLKRVWAETMAVNVPSRRVMEKIGMRHTATEIRGWDDPLPGNELGEVTYEVTKTEWTQLMRTPMLS